MTVASPVLSKSSVMSESAPELRLIDQEPPYGSAEETDMKTMLKVSLGCAALACAFAISAQTLPADWRASGASPQKYSMTMSPGAAFEGANGVTIESIRPVNPNEDFGTIVQAVTAEPWRGQRVAMRAWIKTENADSGQMWLRIDAADRSLFMDNMDSRPIVGTNGWKQYETVMEVPQDAAYLVYGVFLVGGGRVDIDSVEFEAVPRTVKLSRNIYKPWQLRPPRGSVYTPPSVVLGMPSNLDFEQAPP